MHSLDAGFFCAVGKSEIAGDLALPDELAVEAAREIQTRVAVGRRHAALGSVPGYSAQCADELAVEALVLSDDLRILLDGLGVIETGVGDPEFASAHTVENSVDDVEIHGVGTLAEEAVRAGVALIEELVYHIFVQGDDVVGTCFFEHDIAQRAFEICSVSGTDGGYVFSGSGFAVVLHIVEVGGVGIAGTGILRNLTTVQCCLP